MHLNLQDHLSSTLGDLIHAVGQVKAKPLGDLTLRELAVQNAPFHGLYVFFAPGGKCSYVGSCVSRSFIGRLSSHADPRHDYGMNNFVLALMRTHEELTFTNAHDQALASEVALIGIADGYWPEFVGRPWSNGIRHLERAMQSHMSARYNRLPRAYRAPPSSNSVRDTLNLK